MPTRFRGGRTFRLSSDHPRARAWLAGAALVALVAAARTAPAAEGALVPLVAAGRTAPAELSGFSAEHAVVQQALEKTLGTDIKAANLDTWMKELTAHPHHVGSPWDQHNAEYIATLLRGWGYQTRIETFDVLFPTPLVRRLTLTAPTRFEAQLTEDILAEDAATADRAAALPPYNAYSVDGDVEGELVYVNYGLPEDYELLDRLGISVRGKIVIARYGKSWRGIKPKVAAEHGAIGCLIYSDPSDDGYVQGDVYPAGAFKNASAVQRGSVLDLPLRAGDPLTPDRGATAGVKRFDRNKSGVLTAIPTLPISYRDAAPLLRALAGPVADKTWRGGLDLTYHTGPGPARVHLTVAFDWQIRPVNDVIATWPGAELPAQWIIRGNHHDAWNHGAADPVSGLVALLEEARVIAALAHAGHPPRRTIVFAAWDGEEPGLLGSTEWAEQHADELTRNAVAYLNTDGNSRGFAGVGGSHSLEPFMTEVLRDVADPQTGATLLARRRAGIEINGDEAQQKELADAPLRLTPLGSGSDYTPFLQHLGIASVNSGFGGEGNDGSYHTLYDTYTHFTRFKDPGQVYGAALAQLNARAVLRLANADVLPFDFGAMLTHLSRYADELAQLADKQRAATELDNKRIADGTWRLALDPTKTLRAPATRTAVPFFDLAPLRNALVDLRAAVDQWQSTRAAALTLPDAARATLDGLLFGSERLLLHAPGLPRRPWYRHEIYAPGFYTGYGVKTLPGVREAIEERRYDEVDAQVRIVAATVRAYAARVRQVTAATVAAQAR